MSVCLKQFIFENTVKAICSIFAQWNLAGPPLMSTLVSITFWHGLITGLHSSPLDLMGTIGILMLSLPYFIWALPCCCILPTDLSPISKGPGAVLPQMSVTRKRSPWPITHWPRTSFLHRVASSVVVAFPFEESKMKKTHCQTLEITLRETGETERWDPRIYGSRKGQKLGQSQTVTAKKALVLTNGMGP